MRILFLTISKAISNVNNRGIYPDLLRTLSAEGHEVYVVCPEERGNGKKSYYRHEGNVHTLGVLSFKIIKSNLVEKTLATMSINALFYRAIRKHLKGVEFDLILYATPPITFNSLIRRLKESSGAKTYLMLKDIFPQNAIDLQIMSKKSPLYGYFRRMEKELYQLSDFIGCMSPANKEYLTKHNPEISEEKVGICPNAIEIREREYIEPRPAIREKYGIPQDAVVFIFGGNLGMGQGIDFLLEVLASNKGKSDRFFLLVGSGNRYKKIKDWMDANEPENALLVSVVPREDYEKLENASNVGLVFLDRKFTIPNFPSRILSYLECKLPLLIATDTACDLGPIAEENQFGLWAETGDLDAVNKNIDTLVLQDNLRSKYGESGFTYLKSHFSVKHAYDAIMEQVGKA